MSYTITDAILRPVGVIEFTLLGTFNYFILTEYADSSLELT